MASKKVSKASGPGDEPKLSNVDIEKMYDNLQEELKVITEEELTSYFDTNLSENNRQITQALQRQSQPTQPELTMNELVTHTSQPQVQNENWKLTTLTSLDTSEYMDSNTSLHSETTQEAFNFQLSQNNAIENAI